MQAVQNSESCELGMVMMVQESEELEESEGRSEAECRGRI
jgi:hypothetical protein